MAARVDVRKTYKLYIGGKFPRSESGRTYAASLFLPPIHTSACGRRHPL